MWPPSPLMSAFGNEPACRSAQRGGSVSAVLLGPLASAVAPPVRAVAPGRRRSAAGMSGRRMSNASRSPTGIGRTTREDVCKQQQATAVSEIDLALHHERGESVN